MEATEAPEVFGDRRLATRAGVALLVANARYWTTVAPLVHAQLHRWERRATEIPDPQLRALALAQLRDERLNAEAGAVFATLSPRAYRAPTVELIVAVQVLYDYLDALAEQSPASSEHEHRALFHLLVESVTPPVEAGGGSGQPRRTSGEHRYLMELVAAGRHALARLPGASGVSHAVRSAAMRCAEAQTRVHAPVRNGVAELEAWALREAPEGVLEWREHLAGAVTSVLCVYPMIAAATRTEAKRHEAVQLDALYLSICALSTLLDSLIDEVADALANRPRFLRLYDSYDQLAESLVRTARRAATAARSAPDSSHHLMMLVGVVAYYASAPQARDEPARSVIAPLCRELAPLIGPALAVMRTWRTAKTLRRSWPPGVAWGERRHPLALAPSSPAATRSACTTGAPTRGDAYPCAPTGSSARTR